MLRLLIQFADAELNDFRWATFDETADSCTLDWQQADADELPALAAQIPYPLIIVIPQQCVYLTQVELPERASRQVLSAIEYQVEDQLAQDIESQHFAIGDSSENPVAIAVVARSIMERCMTLVRSHDLRLTQIIPELFLCPWPGDGVALTEGYHGYLLRYDKYRGLKCTTQALPAMLDLIKRDFEFDTIRFYGAEDEAAPVVGQYKLQQQAFGSTRLGELVDGPVIDLQQRDYQLSSAWRELAKNWKWIALLFAGLLMVGAYNKAMAWYDLKGELADIKQQQYALIKPYLPTDTSPDANLKKLLIERVKQHQASQREQGFLRLILEFTRARSKFPEVKISRIGYQANKLSFDINSNKLNDIEALFETVKKQGVKARLLSLSIKPDQSSGRLELQGDGDV
jgi:general secretion pathway protein L